MLECYCLLQKGIKGVWKKIPPYNTNIHEKIWGRSNGRRGRLFWVVRLRKTPCPMAQDTICHSINSSVIKRFVENLEKLLSLLRLFYPPAFKNILAQTGRPPMWKAKLYSWIHQSWKSPSLLLNSATPYPSINTDFTIWTITDRCFFVMIMLRIIMNYLCILTINTHLKK